jgi:hypothetical protein
MRRSVQELSKKLMVSAVPADSPHEFHRRSCSISVRHSVIACEVKNELTFAEVFYAALSAKHSARAPCAFGKRPHNDFSSSTTARPQLIAPRHPPPSSPTSKMGRLHSNGKGISASAIPYSRTAPAWLKTTPEQVVEQMLKLAKKGATPSQ